MICVCRYARVVHSLLYASCRIGVFVVDAYRFTSLFIISILVKWRRWTRSKEKNIDDGVTFHWESKMSNYFDKHIQPNSQFGWSSLINWAYNGLDLLKNLHGKFKKNNRNLLWNVKFIVFFFKFVWNILVDYNGATFTKSIWLFSMAPSIGKRYNLQTKTFVVLHIRYLLLFVLIPLIEICISVYES